MAFGCALAIEGDRAIVGARHDQAGSVYVFERVNGVWTQMAKLVPSDGQQGDLFGASLALDGDVIAVGAVGKAGPLGAYTGGVYVFERVNGAWVETQRLAAPDGAADDHFGNGLALAGGDLLVGAWGADTAAGDEGALHAFLRQQQGFVHAGVLAASDGAASQHFGFAAALAAGQAFVGARHAEDGNAVASGAAYAMTHFGAFRPIAPGCPGSGGEVPRLALGGCPTPGGTVTLTITHALGGAPALLLAGGAPAQIPLPGACLLQISPLLQAEPFVLAGAGAGTGTYSVAGTLSAAMAGILPVQVYVADPAAPLGVVLSNGVEVTIE
jgi:hypothetical protein